MFFCHQDLPSTDMACSLSVPLEDLLRERFSVTGCRMDLRNNSSLFFLHFDVCTASGGNFVVTGNVGYPSGVSLMATSTRAVS